MGHLRFYGSHSQMLRSLVFTGVNPMISIESEEFGTNYHKDSSFSFLILSDQYSLSWEIRMTAGVLLGINQWEIHGKWWVPLLCRFLGLPWCKNLWCFLFSLLTHPGFWLLINHLLALCFLFLSVSLTDSCI